MKNNLQRYESTIDIDGTHRKQLRQRLEAYARPTYRRRWWLLAPAVIGFATIAFVLRMPSALPEVRAAELLRKAADAFVTVPEGKVLRVSRSMTGEVTYDDGRVEYGVTGSDDILFDGESYAWTTFAAQTIDGVQASVLAATLAVLNDNGITYTKYDWIPEGCMENDGVETCYGEQVVSYEMADNTRHLAELYRRADERGISRDDSAEIKRIAAELACNEELNVYAIETDPLYEVLYAQSNLRHVQDYLDGETWCEDKEDCPFTRDRKTGERVNYFLAPTVAIENDMYHLVVPYNPRAVELLTGSAADVLQWEIWIREDGLPSHEVLMKNGAEVQGASYEITYIPEGDIGQGLTYDGWRDASGISDLPYNPSFAPWGYTKAEAEYERSLRLTACAAAEAPPSRSGGTAVPTILIP